MSYIKKEWEHFKRGFSLKRHHILGLIYDIILLLIFVSAVYFFLKAVLNLAFAENPFIGLDLILHESARIYTSFIVGIILFFFIMTAVYSFFKFLIWNNLVGERFHTKSFVKYYLTNLLLFGTLIALQIWALFKFGSTGLIIAAVLAVVFHHFNRFFKLHYVKHKHVRKALLLAVKKGLSIHEFLFVYVLVAIFAYSYIFIYQILSSFWVFVLTPLIVLLMGFWLRHYFKQRHEF